jgi:hypothetical protein
MKNISAPLIKSQTQNLLICLFLTFSYQARAQDPGFDLEKTAEPSRQISQEIETSSQNIEQSTSADGKSQFKVKRIKHPGAKEGLYLIDEEGVYHYRVQNLSKKDNSMFLRFISQTSPNLTGTLDGDRSFSFTDMYEVTDLTGIDFVYEWQPFKKYGKLGVQGGVGFASATARGYFKSNDAALKDLVPRESYTFYSIPVSLGLVYRFEYLERQWAAPYICGGGIYNGLIENRSDSKVTAVGTPAAYGAGGVLLNLTAFNKDLAFTMDREYGFSQLWLSFEYRHVESFNKDLDITSNQIGVGIGADY